MRRAGIALMVLGLVLLLAVLVVQETARAGERAAAWLETGYYAGAGLCLAGLALLVVNKLARLGRA